MTPRTTLLVGLTAMAALGTGIVWSSTSSAGTSSRPKASAAVVTIAPGRVLAGNCFQCHGTNGSGGPWERLTGESEAELYNELMSMKSGGEEAGTIMQIHAQGYSDAQLRAIAKFFATAK